MSLQKHEEEGRAGGCDGGGSGSKKSKPKLILVRMNSGRMVPNQASSCIPVVQTPKRKLVTFSTVEIREYPMTVGDNPSVSRGVPVTIEWNYVHVETIQVSALVDIPKRKESSLLLSSLERARILRDWGHSKFELKEAMYVTDRARRQREETAQEALWELQNRHSTPTSKTKANFWQKAWHFVSLFGRHRPRASTTIDGDDIYFDEDDKKNRCQNLERQQQRLLLQWPKVSPC